MARKGITESDVAAAIAELRQAGLTAPSIRMIHQKLGRGSLTTIARHKRALDTQSRAEGGAGLPDTVQDAMATAAQSVWDELLEAADSVIAQAQATATKKVVESEEGRARAEQDEALAQAAHAELKSSLADAESQLIKTNKACTKLQDDLSKQKADNKVLAVELRGAERSNKGLDARVVKLQSSASDAQASLKLERKSHTSERQRWETRQDKLQTSLDQKVSQCNELEKKQSVHRSELAAAQSLCKTLKNEKDTLRAQLASLQATSTDQARALGGLEATLTQTKTSHSDAERRWAKERKQLMSLKNTRAKKGVSSAKG